MAPSGNVAFRHPQSFTNQERTEDQLNFGDYPFLMLWTISKPGRCSDIRRGIGFFLSQCCGG
jgi:hypothetical protein